MPDPINDYSTKTKADLLDLLVQRDQEITSIAERLRSLDAAAAELAKQVEGEAQTARARAKERDAAIANKEPPKLIGSISVYLQDEPADIVERARPLFAGRVPLDRATKFRLDAVITPAKDWGIFKRLGHAPRVGETFDAEEIPAKERARYAAQGAITAIA